MLLRPGLHRIQAPLGERFVALYLFEGPDGALLFDTGIADSVTGTLLPYLRTIGFDLARLRWVVSSHCDFDHTGGNAVLAEAAPHAEFLAGEADVAMTEDLELLITGRYGEFAGPDGFDDPPATTALVRASTRLRPVDRALHGGEVFDLGDRRIEVLAAPGHSPGHLALWDATHRALAISDAVLGETVPTADGAPAFPPTYRDLDPYLATIRRLQSMHPELVLTAHYPVYEDEAAREFLAVSERYTQRVDAAVTEALRTAGTALTTRELISRIAGRLGSWDPAAAEYLIFPVTGHLERMLRAGDVRELRESGPRRWEWGQS